MDVDAGHRVVLGLLLEHHPRLLTTDEIRVEVGDEVPVDAALEQLVADGVALKLGGLYGPSWATVRTAPISPI